MSSFHPSFSSFPDFDAGSRKGSTNFESSSDRNREKRKKRRHRSKERESDPKRDRKLDKSRHKSPTSKERRRRRDEDEPTQQNAAQFHEPQELNLAFYSDRKGDFMNIQYGGLHAGDVPKYRLVAGGRNVLGLPKALVVLRRVGKGVEVGLTHQRKAPSLTSSASRALLSKPPSRRLIPCAGNDKYAEVDGIIRLPSRRGPENAEESYRSITTTKDDEASDSSPSSESDVEISSDEDSDSPVLTAHQETLKRLEQELEAQPDQADTWLSLLNQSLSTIPITSKNATKARCEITVSILSRALSASSLNLSNKRLRLAYLKAGEEVWHESKLRSEWEGALKEGGIEIQIEWLEWKIRKGNGGILNIVESAVRALNNLGMQENDEIAKVRIFWRVATAIRNAGYTERATAMFQAQVELTFNPPPNVAQMAFQTQLNELEDFWDSEIPRFGEEGAKGWASWYSSTTEETLPPSQSVQQPVVTDLDPYRQWANQELQSDYNMYLPQRSDSDTLDPYSTVLFADIRPTLINAKCRRAKHAIRIAWLSFLGLHLPGLSLAANREVDWDDRWNLGYLTTPHSLNSIFPSDTGQTKLLTDAVAGAVVGREREHITPFGPVRCWGDGVSGPLDLSSVEPGKVLRNGVWSKDDLHYANEGFVRRLFLGLRIERDDFDWDILSLAFEVAANPKSAAKLSKTFLSTNQGSLVLWDAHAQLERLRGRFDDARKVYQTILIASKPDQTRRGVSRLWWNWAEMEWLAGNDQQALTVILKSVRMESSESGVVILRTKRLIEEAAEIARGLNGWKEQECWIKLRALLELLTGYEPEAVFGVFDKYVWAESDTCCKESLTTASLIVIYCYGTILKKPMPPSILRERVHKAFQCYGNNSIILGILLEAEKGQGVWGRVRGMLGGNDGKTKDIARRIEEVWVAGWEKGRWLSEVERTRNGLAAAVEHERTRGSSVIWRIYMEFEIRLKELQRARKLLFRAIGECPLVKDLYLLAFGPLRGVFQTHELNALADTMVERGIRLRQGIEELVAGEAEILEESEGEGEDEIEEDARELRRLMPYR
ncbi:hypothetical protein GALMADRAFT_234148 [Galerina marginata CBS 339.88]|uniref:DUF1740-domain-containing protein n=1 Tax=Galerina marginata (strain CBS 339.88) TaxID=685588 RepID=A0A067TZ79_GALM3|nr:hypothetical protein GALMADRAFT_234148 [Galerina marginata CBS 339.88]